MASDTRFLCTQNNKHINETYRTMDSNSADNALLEQAIDLHWVASCKYFLFFKNAK